MKIKLLIATSDGAYATHLSSVLSAKYHDEFEVSVCSSQQSIAELPHGTKFDVALLEGTFEEYIDPTMVSISLLLLSQHHFSQEQYSTLKGIQKYQRISAIVGEVLENLADVSVNVKDHIRGKGKMIAVWSPCGGVGKTTVALAYAARQVAFGRQTTYLNLENFTSTPVYFGESGKSISIAFEKLEKNIQMFLTGIRQLDHGSGIHYFAGPANYDDMNILTSEDIKLLCNACAKEVDTLVVDLSSQCDKRMQEILEYCDTVLVVCDDSVTAQRKLQQFLQQHNISHLIHEKMVLVNNKGGKMHQDRIGKVVQLPFVQSKDAISIYKTLSANLFEW